MGSGYSIDMKKFRDPGVPKLSQYIFPSKVNVSQVFRNVQKKLNTEHTILLLLRHSSMENTIVRCYMDERVENSNIINTRICRTNRAWMKEKDTRKDKKRQKLERVLERPVTGYFLDFIWPQIRGDCKVLLIDKAESVVNIDDLFQRTLTYVIIKARSTLWKGVSEKIPQVGSMMPGQFEYVTPNVMWKRFSQFPRVQWFTPDVNVAATFAQLFKSDLTKAYVIRLRVREDIKLLNLDLAAIKYLRRVAPQLEKDLDRAFPVKKTHVQRYSVHAIDLPLFGEMCSLRPKLIEHGFFSNRKFLVEQKLPTRSIVPEQILARELALCNAHKFLELMDYRELVLVPRKSDEPKRKNIIGKRKRLEGS